MFVGYSTAHDDNTYCMWDPRSRRVHITRDICWLNKMFFDWSDTVHINCTEGIRRISKNMDDKTVRSDDNQNNRDDSDESVEDLVSESFDNAIADDAGKRNEEDINRSGEQVTTTRYGRSIRQPAR
jgi:hypothetical protein